MLTLKLCLLFVFICRTITIAICQDNYWSIKTFSTSIIVTFDPYVSILDKENRYRYSVSDLQPFVEKVSTRFNRCLVELSYEDLQEDSKIATSRSRSSLAIAEHNNATQTNSSSTRLEVWLAYVIDPDKRPVLNLNTVTSRLHKIASESNQKFNGTVTTLLLPQHLVMRLPQNYSILNIIPRSYKWGIMLDKLTCTYSVRYRKKLQKMHPNVIVGSFFDVTGKADLITALNRTMNECQSEHTEKSIETATLYTAPDTFDHTVVNTSRLVSTWYRLMELSQEIGFIAILSKAFDTPYEQRVQRKSCGWWRLVENPKYKSTKDYIFQEKLPVTKQIDEEESTVNLTWLEEEVHFSREHVGIILSHSSSQRQYSEEELDLILNKISRTFSKVMLLVEDANGFKNERKILAGLKDAVELGIMFMPHVQVRDYFHDTDMNSHEGLSVSDDLFTSYVVPFVGNDTMNLLNDVNARIRATRTVSRRIAVSFNISVCTQTGDEFQDKVNEIVRDNNDVQNIVFYFEEDEETVKLGARRMYEQRIVLFEQCRNFLIENGKTGETKSIVFIMLHYASYSEFHSNPLALQNFVRYWDMLSGWAGSTKTTIIFSNAVDGKRQFNSNQNPVSEVGWWKYRDSGDGETNSVWIDKKEEALRLAMQRFPKIDEKKEPTSSQSSGFGTGKLLLVVLLPLFIAVLVVFLGVYLIRRHYRERCITKNELNDFFNGDISMSNEATDEITDANKIPYDKTRFEIDAKAFKIEMEGKLGSGEFGLVCRGKLENENGTVNVAVKMIHPDKFRKTTLNGLLSEIKVLAHVGKHENINQLLGANTSDLENGKVFIFLELCLLGSLEKYLRKLRPTQEVNRNLLVEKTLQARGDNRYVNTPKVTSTEALLDPSVSLDLVRWSKEICNGMAYLATKHVVHADLATRNVLLNMSKDAKICDFGLSRRMYNYTNYVKEHQEPLPWKWMAPESLRLSQFSEKSDVWAYGVTLWEIYSLGDTPYPGLSWDVNFPQMLQLGFRLSEPKYSTGDMYSVMKTCWNINPEKRPTFTDLLENDA